MGRVQGYGVAAAAFIVAIGVGATQGRFANVKPEDSKKVFQQFSECIIPKKLNKDAFLRQGEELLKRAK